MTSHCLGCGKPETITNLWACGEGNMEFCSMLCAYKYGERRGAENALCITSPVLVAEMLNKFSHVVTDENQRRMKAYYVAASQSLTLDGANASLKEGCSPTRRFETAVKRSDGGERPANNSVRSHTPEGACGICGSDDPICDCDKKKLKLLR